MHPRTVKMAAEVASQFSGAQIDDYGNIIQNGYLSVVPNNINKKAWQYQETTTAPVDLPSLTEVRPAYKGWTTNYMQYYTELKPNAYNQNPGNPTMFEYFVHSFAPQRGPVTGLAVTGYSDNYNPGTYTNVAAATTYGTGSGIRVGFTIDLQGKFDPGSLVITNPGSNYGAGSTIQIAAALPWGGSGPITARVMTVVKGAGGEGSYAQAPRRFNQLAVDNVSTPQYVNNPAVIQYSFLHPVVDNPDAPPIGNLNI